MTRQTQTIPNVSESLEGRLETLLLGGAFWPDRPLASERRLCAELGVSRTPLRAALASLKDRAVFVQHGRDLFPTSRLADTLMAQLTPLSDLSSHPVIELFVLMIHGAHDLAWQKGLLSDRANLQQDLSLFQGALQSATPSAACTAFLRVTRGIIDGCYNQFLCQTYIALERSLEPFFATVFQGLAKSAEQARTFEQLVCALIDRRDGGNGLVRFLCDHIPKTTLPSTGVPVQTTRLSLDPLKGLVARHPRALDALYELRLILESQAAMAAAQNISPAQTSRLQTHMELMARSLDQGTTGRGPDFPQLDVKLHRLISEGCANPLYAILNQTLDPLLADSTEHWLTTHRELGADHALIHAQHLQIIQAICAGQSAVAKLAMEDHLHYVLNGLRRLREQDRLGQIALARRALQ